MSCGLDQSCGMNAQTCEMEQTCSAPMQCETSCAPAPTHCEAAPCQQSYTMPCNYNECGQEEETCDQRTGFRQSVRNMFRRHSESSCSEQGYECDYNNCNPCETQQTCEMPCMPEPVCQPCQPVCMPEPVCPPKPVMKKAYRTEKYTVQVPTEKKVKVAVCVPSFEKKSDLQTSHRLQNQVGRPEDPVLQRSERNHQSANHQNRLQDPND